jgi:hypothetical protein
MGSKRHEMFREITKMGFEIVNGGKHYQVIAPRTGEMLGILPRGQNAYGGAGTAHHPSCAVFECGCGSTRFRRPARIDSLIKAA